MITEKKIGSLIGLDKYSHKLYKNIYPLPFEKYICFFNFSEPNQYDLMQDVVDDIAPYLTEKNIKIVNIVNHQSLSLRNCYNCSSGKISQINFLIQNSLLNISNSTSINIASNILGSPILFLCKDKKQDNHIHFNQNINEIKTEEISQKILRLLNINNNIKYKTLFSGEKYLKNYEYNIIPCEQFNIDQITSLTNHKDFNVNLRFDLAHKIGLKNVKFNMDLKRILSSKNFFICFSDIKQLSQIQHNKLKFYINENTTIESVENVLKKYPQSLFIHEGFFNFELYKKFYPYKYIKFFKNLPSDINIKTDCKYFVKTTSTYLYNNNSYISFQNLIQKNNKNNFLFQNLCNYEYVKIFEDI